MCIRDRKRIYWCGGWKARGTCRYSIFYSWNWRHYPYRNSRQYWYKYSCWCRWNKSLWRWCSWRLGKCYLPEWRTEICKRWGHLQYNLYNWRSCSIYDLSLIHISSSIPWFPFQCSCIFCFSSYITQNFIIRRIECSIFMKKALPAIHSLRRRLFRYCSGVIPSIFLNALKK